MTDINNLRKETISFLASIYTDLDLEGLSNSQDLTEFGIESIELLQLIDYLEKSQKKTISLDLLSTFSYKVSIETISKSLIDSK